MKSNRNNNYTLFPIQDNEIWKAYQESLSSFWTVGEVDLGNDKWDDLSNDEKHFIKYILAFFAGSDGIVVENLALKFMKDIDIPEVRCFYGFQIAIENIHSEMYSTLIETYIKDPNEKDILFDSLSYIPCIKKKAKWALKWINDTNCFEERLVAFACVEGIQFSGAFCSIYWLKQRNLLPGLCFSNELISKDEALHTRFAILLYLKSDNKLHKTRIYEIVSEAVAIEKEFICEAVPCAMIGMNSNLMSQYIEYVADRLIVQLGYDTYYKSTNPFTFMELISLRGKANFFERKVSEYSRANVNTESLQTATFTTTAEF